MRRIANGGKTPVDHADASFDVVIVGAGASGTAVLGDTTPEELLQVTGSPLADATGWVDVDQATRRHETFENIRSLSDGLNAPNAKTVAAERKQAPVVADNVVVDIRDCEPDSKCGGYGSYPLTAERGKIVLAEFGFGASCNPAAEVRRLMAPNQAVWHGSSKRKFCHLCIGRPC